MTYMRHGTPFSKAYPDFLKQWHPDNDLKPETTSRSSNKKVLWQCEVSPEHTWYASPNGGFKPSGKVLGCPYCSGTFVNVGVNDLASQYPDVAKQWSSRNELSPSEVHARSNKEFWWVGDCGHEWDAAVLGRTAQCDGCPYCSGHRVLKGFNDLNTLHPELAEEWCDDRDVSTVTPGSGYKARWRGRCGHTWDSMVTRRVRGEGCPYCSGHRVLKGFNDLASKRPDLADIWHPSNPRGADEVTAGSAFMATWVCPEGHITKARVIEKVSHATKCPVCEGTVTVKGVTDFATKHPELAKQWVKGDKRPTEVRPMSSVNVTWRCEEGHEWKAPFHRRARGHGCPYCAGQRAIAGVNDLAFKFPELIKEWHPDNNVDPSRVAHSSSAVYMWKCSDGHEWAVSPNQRTSHKEGITGCPVCWASGRSSAEAELCSFIKGVYGGEVVPRHRLGRLELDVYLPELDLAFEFNGVHWHSERCGKGPTSHVRKVNVCNDAGISLVQIWEDDWRDRRSVVEKMIVRKIGIDMSPRVGARTTTVVSASAADVRGFLDTNHIQGFVGGTNYDALVSRSGEVVAVMVTTNLKRYVRLDRYATSTSVPGGFSKLLKVVTSRARCADHDLLVTFSDNEISDGNLYRTTGFRAAGNLAPDYKYLYNSTRTHKFLFRKERFRRDPSLKYDPSLTESELATLNNLSRVWDSGKVRWELDL